MYIFHASFSAKNNEIKSKWREIIIKNNLEKQICDNIRVCSKHFKNQCFKQDKNDGTTKKLLRMSCISSLFLKVQENFHSNLVNEWRLLLLKVI
jgi:hypothetical protein